MQALFSLRLVNFLVKYSETSFPSAAISDISSIVGVFFLGVFFII